MADSTERNKNLQEAQSSSPPRIEPEAADEAPSSEPSSHHGQSWFQQLKHWSPSLVLENTGSVGRGISSMETEGRAKIGFKAVEFNGVVSLRRSRRFLELMPPPPCSSRSSGLRTHMVSLHSNLIGDLFSGSRIGAALHDCCFTFTNNR